MVELVVLQHITDRLNPHLTFVDSCIKDSLTNQTAELTVNKSHFKAHTKSSPSSHLTEGGVCQPPTGVMFVFRIISVGPRCPQRLGVRRYYSLGQICWRERRLYSDRPYLTPRVSNQAERLLPGPSNCAVLVFASAALARSYRILKSASS